MDKASDFGSEDLWCVSFRGRTILDLFKVMGMAGHPAIDSDESFFIFVQRCRSVAHSFSLKEWINMSTHKVPPRFEVGSRDSKSRVLTIAPWDHVLCSEHY